MTHPVVLAARAAITELTTDEAKDFFKSTALEHSMLTMFYFLEAVYWTVEAGRLTRRFVDSFSTPEPEAEVKIAGLLCPAKDEPPITTEAVVTNEQKLEQHITQVIKGIYDNVQSNQESDEVGDRQDCDPIVEPLQEPVSSQVDLHSKTEERPTPPRRRRSCGSAASGNRGEGMDKPNPEGRVSGTGNRVQGKRHAKDVDV